MTQLGNSIVNSTYESNTHGWKKPTPHSSMDKREAYIRAKYVDKLFISAGEKMPQTVSIPLTVVDASESEDSDGEEPENVQRKPVVTFDSPSIVEPSVTTGRASPKGIQKSKSQPVSPHGVRRWTVSKHRKSKSGILETPEMVEEARSISDTETLPQPGLGRRKKVLRKLKKLSSRKKLLNMNVTMTRGKQGKELEESSEQLKLVAEAKEGPSKVRI